MNYYTPTAIIKPNSITLYDFLASARYSIPPYQRKYEWSESQFQKLWQDIKKVFSENIENKTVKLSAKPHFLGSIVLQNSAHEERYEIIDGQQRTTTFLCLLSVLAEFIDNIKDVQKKKNLSSLISPLIGQYIPMKGNEARLLIGRDNDFFHKMLFDHTTQKQREEYCSNKSIKKGSSAKNIKDCFDFFYSEIEAHVQDDEKKLGYDQHIESLSLFIVYYLFLMKVEVSGYGMAYQLFESMNFRGLALSQADLLKNNLLGIAAKVNKEKQVSDFWSVMVNEIEDQDKLDLPEFIQFHFISKFGRVKASSLFENISTHLMENGINPVDYSESLKEEACNICEIINGSSSFDSKISDVLEDINKVLDVKFIYPLLLSGYAKYKSDNDGLYKFFLFARNFCFRYAKIQAEGLSNVEKAMGELARHLRESDSSLDSLREKMLELSPDSKFKSNFKSYTLSNSKIGFYCIHSIENFLSKNSGVNAYKQSPNQHLEHVMPKKPKADWPHIDPLDPEFNEHLYKLGNLLVLEQDINAHIKNKSIDYKLKNNKKLSYETSSLRLPNTISEFMSGSKWGYEEITKRTNKLVELYAVDIWSL